MEAASNSEMLVIFYQATYQKTVIFTLADMITHNLNKESLSPIITHFSTLKWVFLLFEVYMFKNVRFGHC
jgi:hypothetical protein